MICLKLKPCKLKLDALLLHLAPLPVHQLDLVQLEALSELNQHIFFDLLHLELVEVVLVEFFALTLLLGADDCFVGLFFVEQSALQPVGLLDACNADGGRAAV